MGHGGDGGKDGRPGEGGVTRMEVSGVTLLIAQGLLMFAAISGIAAITRWMGLKAGPWVMDSMERHALQRRRKS